MGPHTKSDRGGEVCQIARKGLRQIIRKATSLTERRILRATIESQVHDVLRPGLHLPNGPGMAVVQPYNTDG
jgi:hypothetical protein